MLNGMALREDEILKNGIITCRISYSDKETEKKIDQYIIDNDILIFRDGKIKTQYYHGNHCIVGFPFDEAIKIKNIYNITIDLIRSVLSKREIENLKMGDKITFTSDNNMIGLNCTNKGTVYKVEENNVTILKYRSQKKGWKLSVGQNVTIKKGW